MASTSVLFFSPRNSGLSEAKRFSASFPGFSFLSFAMPTIRRAEALFQRKNVRFSVRLISIDDFDGLSFLIRR
uniref:Uncharacterized protein n=1 Tax=Strigamia maritima TaxID=126957 RepID=T1J082_STRMM